MSMEVRVHTHGPGKLKTKTMIADELGFCVTSCLIMGEKDCVLIDTQDPFKRLQSNCRNS
jgi:hypothetical protein